MIPSAPGPFRGLPISALKTLGSLFQAFTAKGRLFQASREGLRLFKTFMAGKRLFKRFHMNWLVSHNMRAFALAIALAALISQASAHRAGAATAAEVLAMLPPEQVRGLSPALRRDLLDRAHQGASGYSAPSPEGNWLELHGENALTMYGSGAGPLVLKVFPASSGWTLAVICRSRQTQGPSSMVEPPHDSFLDLSLFILSPVGDLHRAEYADYLPPINVLDFMTAETIEDPGAVRDLAIIDESFADCLTCHASAQDPLALDILTVTSVNGHSCAHLLAQFKLLPLKWTGERFTKPYDRAAPFLPEKPPPEKPHGIYYHDVGK